MTIFYRESHFNFDNICFLSVLSKVYFMNICVDCSVISDSLQPLPGSSVHGILLARILEWVAIPFSRGSSQLRDETWISCIEGRFFTV